MTFCHNRSYVIPFAYCLLLLSHRSIPFETITSYFTSCHMDLPHLLAARVIGMITTSQRILLSVIFQQTQPILEIFYCGYYLQRHLFNSRICCRASAGTFTPNRRGYYCIAAGAGCKLRNFLTGGLYNLFVSEFWHSLFLYCPTRVFLKVHLPEMISLFQESNIACGIWNLACIKASLCLLAVRKVTANKINDVGEGRGFLKINLVSVHLHWQASQKTFRVDRGTSWKE